MTGRDNLVDKRWPVVRPLLLQDGDEYKVQFVYECSFFTKTLFGARGLYNEVDDKIPDA